MKIRYFKDNDAYFKFINKNKEKLFETFIVSFSKNKIKVLYKFI